MSGLALFVCDVPSSRLNIADCSPARSAGVKKMSAAEAQAPSYKTPCITPAVVLYSYAQDQDISPASFGSHPHLEP